MDRNELLCHLNELLHPEFFKDYAPNGLQVEGKTQVCRIVTAVTATQNVIDRAVQWKADALLVHHGWFWKGENPAIVRTKYKRLKALMDAEINLLAYHLPLDAHPDLGNNALMGKMLGATHCRQTGEGELLWLGEIKQTNAQSLADFLSTNLARKPLILGDELKRIKTVAWCSGAAENFFEEAILAGADAFISGEAAERSTHLAREAGVPYLVCGHHATERLGIQALGRWLQEKYALECLFVDDENPL